MLAIAHAVMSFAVTFAVHPDPVHAERRPERFPVHLRAKSRLAPRGPSRGVGLVHPQGQRRKDAPGMTADRLDVSLEDGELLGEVELTVRLILAANDSDSRLSPHEVDRILGIASP